ncbi:MAG: alginate O-acetyltransferase AlgX-related protein [Puniceicoccales bacterium]
MDREKEAWEELERSSVNCGSRWLLGGVFLLSIFSVFAIDLWHPYGVRDAVRNFAERSRPLETGTSGMTKVQAWNQEVIADIESFEEQIEDESFLSKTIPFYQWFMVRILGTSGTGRVLVGRDNWYFLKESLETGLGWPGEGSLREADGAIRRLAGELSQRGIRLILVPIPGKVEMFPGKFSSRFSPGEVLPPSELRERYFRNWASLPGVEVVSSRELLEGENQRGRPTFLERDTHWTPAGMEVVAVELASLIRGPLLRPSTETQWVSGFGDLVEMMRLPASVTAEEEVAVERVPGSFSGDLPPEIIFLGDSFAAVYSDAVLGWGENAGLEDLLPMLVGQPVDFRLNYGDPVSGPGRQLERILHTRESESMPRVVVWEFAERFLDEGDWGGLFR